MEENKDSIDKRTLADSSSFQNMSPSARAAYRKHLESLSQDEKEAFVTSVENPAPLTPEQIRKIGRGEIILGIALILTGLAITFTSYALVAEGGGTYAFMYGPIVTGGIILARGLNKHAKANR